MTQARGHHLALRTVEYLSAFFPGIRPGPKNARKGTPKVDALNTPGFIFEIKTPRDFRPTEWAAQARGYVRDGELPIVIYFPERIGEKSIDASIAMLPLGELMRLLVDAGRIPPPF